MEPEVWVVRAAKQIADKVEQASILAIGWAKLGDLTGLHSKEEFQERYRNTYGGSEGQILARANQLFRFVTVIQKGDFVITPLSLSGEYLIGRVIGEYSFDPKIISPDYPNLRHVEWLKKIPKDIFSATLKGSSGSILTLFKVSDNLEEIRRILNK